MVSHLPFVEHRIPSGQARLYVRDYAGAGPAFVLMHGLPDNLRIYAELIPLLAAAGRRVVAFDFLGFGASDRLSDGGYSYAQQVGDLAAVVEGLDLAAPVLVPHDSSGFAAINYALGAPGRVGAISMLNSAYADVTGVYWPEMIELAARPSLRALSDAILQTPAQFGWLLGWQKLLFRDALPADQRAHFDADIGKVIEDNFVKPPGAGVAYRQMTAEFYDELARNAGRLSEVEALDLPIKLIWGEYDPYLTVAMAEARLKHLKHGSLHRVPAGHWLQSDEPQLVARELLA
ncbi:MAG: alpha/beta fold hydrolase [Phenylobacterium sp.]